MGNEQFHQIGISDCIHSWDYDILNLQIFITVINIFNKSIPMNPTSSAFQLKHVVIDQAFLFKGTFPFSHYLWYRICSRFSSQSFPQEIIKNNSAITITSPTNGPDCGKSKATLQRQKDEQLSKKVT